MKINTIKQRLLQFEAEYHVKVMTAREVEEKANEIQQLIRGYDQALENAARSLTPKERRNYDPELNTSDYREIEITKRDAIERGEPLLVEYAEAIARANKRNILSKIREEDLP